MFFVMNSDEYVGNGKTLLEALKSLNDQGEHDDIRDLVFYKAQKIDVVLLEAEIKTPAPKTTIKK